MKPKDRSKEESAGVPRGAGPAAAGNGKAAGEFDSFLAELAGVVAERVRALNTKTPSQPDPVFFDETKTVLEWPEISAYVIEELR